MDDLRFNASISFPVERIVDIEQKEPRCAVTISWCHRRFGVPQLEKGRNEKQMGLKQFHRTISDATLSFVFKGIAWMCRCDVNGMSIHRSKKLPALVCIYTDGSRSNQNVMCDLVRRSRTRNRQSGETRRARGLEKVRVSECVNQFY